MNGLVAFPRIGRFGALDETSFCARGLANERLLQVLGKGTRVLRWVPYCNYLFLLFYARFRHVQLRAFDASSGLCLEDYQMRIFDIFTYSPKSYEMFSVSLIGAARFHNARSFSLNLGCSRTGVPNGSVAKSLSFKSSMPYCDYILYTATVSRKESRR